MEQRINVLLIEDDPDAALLVGLHLNEACGPDLRYAMECAETLSAGLELLTAKDFDAVLLDLKLPDTQGLDGLAAVRGAAPRLPVVVLTNLNDETVGMEAIARGAQDFLSKGKLGAPALKRAIGYALERSRWMTQFEGIIANSAEGMLVVDDLGRILYNNQAAAAFLGQDAKRLAGTTFAFPLKPGTKREIRQETGDGTKVGELRVAEIEWRKGRAYLATIHDITEIRALEQLRAEVKERRRLDQLKDQFLSTVSHELRSPLTVIKAAVANLWDGLAGELSEPQGQMVYIALRNVERLARIINNLLDLSRLESGRASVTARSFDLRKLVDDAVKGARLIDPQTKLSIKTELAAEPCPAHADPDMISQVLQNLLDNAMRHARTTITVSVRPFDAASSEIEVKDDGPGIPRERIPDLFNKFVQVNRPKGGAGYKGTGLGLAICSESLKLNGGHIWVECPESGGAGFVFTLPRTASGQEAQKDAAKK